jgi:hypothetical protein
MPPRSSAFRYETQPSTPTAAYQGFPQIQLALVAFSGLVGEKGYMLFLRFACAYALGEYRHALSRPEATT